MQRHGLIGLADEFARLNFLHFYLPVYAVTFLCAGLLSFVMLVRGGQAEGSVAQFVTYCLPWVRWNSQSTKVDFCLYLASKIFMRWIGILSAAISVFIAVKLGHLLHGGSRPEAGDVALAVIAIAMFAFYDFGNYLSHWMQHRIPWMWEFHKVHHAAAFLTPLTTYRFHPVGNLIDGVVMGVCIAVPACAGALLYKLDIAQLLVLAAAINMVSAIVLLSGLQHTHFPIRFGVLERIFISPQMHQVHHSVKRAHWDKNFGSRLSLWDWACGTAFVLPKGETLTYGIGTIEDERGDYGRVWWCFVGPLVMCWRMARARGRPPAAQNAAQPGVVSTPTAS